MRRSSSHQQLAHDAYVALGDRWGVRVFEEIVSTPMERGRDDR